MGVSDVRMPSQPDGYLQSDRSNPSKSTGEDLPTWGGLWEQMRRNGAGRNSCRQLRRRVEEFEFCKRVVGLNIRSTRLPNRGKLDVDIFPQIIDEKPLFIVSQYGAHYIFIAVIFLPQ